MNNNIITLVFGSYYDKGKSTSVQYHIGIN